ncbi:hypothetical protein KBY96_13540 [Cyanobium sp. ATX 6A2]|uniref:DUF1631 domain-containing protein n=1 Tax=Cyanobium sp. ATX 6A2 TaxID=2823700 RepID=UPI0020CF50B0|nr:DUF1631 domain-containing protein [Cyanobium sp. ATX 6A2]MCP9888948.1 hypothetical protein [Cyanobium sp. ATX 6A2]
MDLSPARARRLARLAAYTLLVIFLVTLVPVALPLPLADPSALLTLLAELLANSSLPLVALVLLLIGLAGPPLPALWELGLARWLPLLLRAVALLYLLSAVAVISIAGRIEATGSQGLEAQVQASVQRLDRLRQSLDVPTDAGALQRLLAVEPALLQALQQRLEAGDDAATLAQQRKLAAELIDRGLANLRAQGVRERAEASGTLRRQVLRLSLSAVVYALFHVLASLIWPLSLADTMLRVLESRSAPDPAADPPPP